MIRKNILLLVVITTTCAFALASGEPAKGSGDKYILAAPPAPSFSTEERHRELAARRKRVANMMKDGSVMILFSAPSRIYTNDVDYPYRQENNLYYLTGLGKNGLTLVLSKSGDSINETLFLPKRDPRFETWNGRMYSNQDAIEISGIKSIVNAERRGDFLKSVKQGVDFAEGGKLVGGSGTVYLLRGDDREYGFEEGFAAQLPESRVESATGIFAKLRLVKSPYEIRIMQHSIDITNEALMRSMGMIGKANWEFEVHAEVDYTFRRRNADSWGYPSIVGCGPNATTLHYIESQGKIGKSDLMLMDVGAEYEHYTADITRTFPVSGIFTKEQAEIYQIVYDAQEAAAEALKPGAHVNDASDAARAVIIDGLFRLGLITKKDPAQVRLWYMHGWGHWLGMNVHDVGNYRSRLEPGMMMTNEPGIYIRPEALNYLRDTKEWNEFKKAVGPVVEKYKNIGVRIEDDMLITKTGVTWMTKALPRSISDIEAFMDGAKKEMERFAMRPESVPFESASVADNRRSKTSGETGSLQYEPFVNARKIESRQSGNIHTH